MTSTNTSGGFRFAHDLMQENGTGELEPPMNTMISDIQAFYIELIVYILMGGIISVFGIVTNIVNIVVFIHQGIFSDSGSASLLGLAFADLFSLCSMFWMCITLSFVLLAEPSDLWWDPWDVWYLAGIWPHIMFAQTSRMVTAYVAFERCVCVVFPFKVKSLLTPRRSIMIISGMFLTFALTHTPLFVEQQLKFRHDPETNTTRLIMISAPTWQQTVDTMWYINTITFNLGSVAIVVICTVITTSRVRLSKSWRESMATGTSSKPEVADRGALSSVDEDHQNKVSKQKDQSAPSKMSKAKLQKEKKLVQMITTISLLFLLSFTPDLTLMIMYTTYIEIRVGSREHNLAMAMYSFTFLMETINSSINILVYYKMSTRYKQELNQLLGIGEKVG